MDMSLSTVCVTPSAATRLAVLFLLGYPLFVAVLARSRRHTVGGLPASVVPAVLTPIFVSLAEAWLGLARLLHALALSTGGRAARAAGASETFVILTFGSIVATLIAIASCAFVRRESLAVGNSVPSSFAARLSAFSLVWTAALLLTLHVVVTSSIVEQIATWPLITSPVAAAVLAGTATVAAILSLTWLLLAGRRLGLQFVESRRTISTCAAATTLLIAYVCWQFGSLWQGVAVRG